MNRTTSRSLIIVLVALGLLVGCEDETESKTRHRSLADAASQLRSSAMVDTTPRGHVAWNGAAQILKASDCYLLDRDYVLVGKADGVAFRLIYRAERAGDASSVDFSHPLMVELRLDERRHDGAVYRAEPPLPRLTEVTSNLNLAFGSTWLDSANPAARRSAPDGVRVEFEFRCS